MEALNPILYYSIFQHPLKKEEILKFSSIENPEALESQLNLLLVKNIIEEKDGYYFYGNPSQIEKRKRGEQAAKNVSAKAERRARLIFRFPYVEGVAFSGSYSKNYFDDQSDIDFFIITTQNRLWIARTLLILFKKTILFNSRKFFCLNYFISTKDMIIQEQNRYSATELVTLKIAHGAAIFNQFFKANQWAFDLFKINAQQNSTPEDKNKHFISILIEKLLKGKIGNNLDNYFKEISLKRWQRKFNFMDPDEFSIALKTEKNVSKHHPRNFQKKVLDKLNQKKEEVNNKFNLKLMEEHA